MTLLLRRTWMFFLIIVCFLATVSLANTRQFLQSEVARPSAIDALQSAQRIFIRTKSVYFKSATLEEALLKRGEIQQWGLVITREEADADLIIEVDRKLFTTRFVYSVIDPRKNTVMTGGKVSSIGGTVEGKIADSFVKRLRQVRPFTSSMQLK